MMACGKERTDKEHKGHLCINCLFQGNSSATDPCFSCRTKGECRYKEVKGINRL